MSYSTALEELRDKVEDKMVKRLSLSEKQKQQLYPCFQNMFSYFPIKFENFSSFKFSKVVEDSINMLDLSKQQKSALGHVVAEIVEITESYLKQAQTMMSLVNMM
ncbi:MAG: hypothetical protein WC849_01340 [Candidatus Paceibacterota bacterium]